MIDLRFIVWPIGIIAVWLLGATVAWILTDLREKAFWQTVKRPSRRDDPCDDCGHEERHHTTRTRYVHNGSYEAPGCTLMGGPGGRIKWCQCVAYRPAPCLCGAYDHDNGDCLDTKGTS